MHEYLIRTHLNRISSRILIVLFIALVGCTQQHGITDPRVPASVTDSNPANPNPISDFDEIDVNPAKIYIQNMIRRGEIGEKLIDGLFIELPGENGGGFAKVYSSENNNYYLMAIYTHNFVNSGNALILFNADGDEEWPEPLIVPDNGIMPKISNSGNLFMRLYARLGAFATPRASMLVNREGKIVRETFVRDESSEYTTYVEEFSPNGELLIVGRDISYSENGETDESVYAIYSNIGEEIYRFNLGVVNPRRALFSPNSRHVLIISNTRPGSTFSVVDVVEKKIIADVEFSRIKVLEIIFPDGSETVRIETDGDPIIYSYPEFVRQ